MTDLTGYLHQERDRHLHDLLEFLRIPSISALSQHRDDVRRAAEWAAQKLREAGMPTVEILETAGHPAVYGEWLVDANQPTALIYGHVDVQPVDPLDLWESPPFEPVIRDGKIHARGACDDKGCLYIPIKALETLTALEGRPPINIKFLLEGEEEVGSPNLRPFLEKEKQRLDCDFVLCADGGVYAPGKPSITVGSRGLAALQIDVQGARADLHSGAYGGAVQNPIHALAAILAGMRTPEGKITVDGFYDDVQELSAAERAAMAQLPFDESRFLEGIGAPAAFGEPGYSILERKWARPTLEVNGIWGGFQGEGTKTVLPAEAHAKITCRLVPEQDPDKVIQAIGNHVQANLPPGVTVQVQPSTGSGRAYLMPADHPVLNAAATVLEEVYGRKPLYTRTGGTLPVAEMVKTILDTDFIFFSFGDPDTQIHAPNEFFRLDSFDKGVPAYVKLLQALAR